ncbi:MAG TPA: Mu transposase C-terminal domain-containing protein [Azospirillaceae bacterium]|nr:Mu transposase C-terminal domain-containing protein [Azospirillaceae bacterium]
MTEILVNQLLGFGDERTERVLWVDPLGRGFYVIDVRSPHALPAFRTTQELSGLLDTKAVGVVENDPWLAPLTDAHVPDAHKEKRDTAWAIIAPMVLDQPAVFQPDARGRAIQRAIAETGLTKQTLYRMLRRYWQRGMTPNTQLPDFNKCGGRGKERAVLEKKRGRKPSSKEVGINVDPEMRNLFRAVVTRKFATNRKLDLRDAYEEVISSHFSDRVIDEHTGRQVLVPRLPVPTLRQFRYWFERDNDVFQIERLRRTPRVYDKDMRALMNSSLGETVGPGSRFQIDATIADIYLVSRYDRRKIVGRPVLYIVIDVFTRMVVGMYAGFEGPSWVGAMMAIANTASDKVTYCRQFGIDITEADWPCHHLPDTLLGDRGELIGTGVDTLCTNFHVHVENTAPYRADWKGVVEQRFRLLPAKYKPYVPGYIEEDFQERGGKDYRLDATLDIDQFTAIIIHCILYYNNHHPLDRYDRHPQMIADEVPAIPIDLWEWGIARRSGFLRAFPADLVKLSLLPTDQATATASGIRYAGCFYSCRKALEEHWFERARQRGVWKVPISYEPRCMDEIYLHDNAGRLNFIACGLTDKSRHHRGRTLWEIDQLRQEERRQHRAHQPQKTQARINLTESIKGIVEQAQAMRDGAPTDGASDWERVRNIRANRREERREKQEQEAFRFGKPGAAESEPAKVLPFPAPTQDDYSTPDITEILRSFNRDKDDDTP